MTVELSELQESARQVMSGFDVPAGEDSTWTQLVELGWLLVTVPEALGGLEMGLAGASTVHLEMGRALSAAPSLPAMMAIEALCHAEFADREAWLERVVSGELVTASLAACELSVAAEGTPQASVSGRVTGVQAADKASHVLVWSADNGCVALIALAQDGVVCEARETWDTSRRLFDVTFSGVALADQVVLATGAAAGALVRRILALRDFALAADAIGGANALLDMTVEHLQTRRQFGRPLALFQALKHRCADLRAMATAAEAMLFDALAKLEGADIATAEQRAMAAKSLATSTFAALAEEALQLHGGIGMASEHPCHLFLKRALLSQQLGRGGDCYEREIAAAMLAAS